MADVKISELTALTSPDGAEELVVNDGGTTKKITITNATSASLPKAGGTMTGVIAGFESTGIDDNATSTAVTIDASENVGIGTSNPSGTLHVNTTHTSTDVTAANSNSTLVIGNSGAGDGVYNAIRFAANQQDMYIMSINDNTAADRRLGFFLGSVAGDAVADERLSIRGDGNVGIGTASPSSKLTSESAASTNIVAKSTNGNGGYYNYQGLASDGTQTFGVNHNGTIFTTSGLAVGGTGAANILSDYETGTWTSSFTNSSVTDGSYVKIGRMVYILGKVSCTSAGGSGTTISGLPFAPSNAAGQQGCGIVGYHNINITEVYSILVSQSSSTFTFRLASTAIEVGAGANFRFNLSYPTNL